MTTADAAAAERAGSIMAIAIDFVTGCMEGGEDGTGGSPGGQTDLRRAVYREPDRRL
jgi:hypothetical protein